MPNRPIHEIPDALQKFDSLPDAANVRQPVVEGLFACSAASVWRHVKTGRIPAPWKFSEKITVWSVADLRRALAEKGS
jgi:predicted DNA-binding transcriptional regulator AlpA